MIRIQGIPIVAARLQAAHRAARQPARRFRAKVTAAHTSARNKVQSGVGTRGAAICCILASRHDLRP